MDMDRTGTNAEGTGPDFRAPTFTPSTKCEDFLRHHSQQLVKAVVDRYRSLFLPSPDQSQVSLKQRAIGAPRAPAAAGDSVRDGGAPHHRSLPVGEGSWGARNRRGCLYLFL
jgi:hypothetical protein